MSVLVDVVDRALRDLAAAKANVETVAAANRERAREARRKVQEARRKLGDAIAQAYLQGARVTDLAARTGFTRETVRVELRRHGIDAE